ncbi:MAG: hypothetical protein B7W99_00730 [Rhodospirillales bacterium 20-58-10]|nr:MAG: hypothetical protein B7W99_00730 [Rhodospirillales bacterium 20-58-10]
MVAALLFLAGLVMQVIGFVDALLMGLMMSAGIPPRLQVAVLVLVAIALVVAAFRLLGGVLSFLIILLLVLLVVHAAFPAMRLPHEHMAIPKLPKLSGA